MSDRHASPCGSNSGLIISTIANKETLHQHRETHTPHDLPCRAMEAWIFFI
jgi:hypothetical protein